MTSSPDAPECVRPCWTWRTYAYGALGWVFTVSLMMYLSWRRIWTAAPAQGRTDWETSVAVRVITYSQCASFILAMPVLIQWIAGFIWPGGIQGPGKLSSTLTGTPTSQRSGLSASLIAGEENLSNARDVFYCFRVCTRGDSPLLVKDTCQRNAALLNEMGVPSIIEVVTDNCLGLPDTRNLKRLDLNGLAGCAHIVQMVVPSTYQTSKGALFKARALNYALKAGGSCLDDEDMIIHLDEETLLHRSSVQGIQVFARAYPDRIGQGVIVYGHGDIVQTIFTAADSVRVADDWCRFRLNLSLETALVGMHGSYVVNSAGLERHVTYDFGPEGSVTEDAFFAIAAIDKGYKFAFIDGYMEEKSPFTFMDFVKQRKRWLNGLTLVGCAPEFSWRLRWILKLSTFAWWLTPLMIPLSIMTLVCTYLIGNIRLPPVVATLQGLAYGTVIWVYVFGASYNFRVGDRPLLYLLRVLMTGCLAPLAGLLESSCVVYAWATPEDVKKPKFHIVEKEYAALKARAGPPEAPSLAIAA